METRNLQQRLDTINAVLAPLAAYRLDAQALAAARQVVAERKAQATRAAEAHQTAQLGLGTIDQARRTKERDENLFEGEQAARIIRQNAEFELTPEEVIAFQARIAEIDRDLPGLHVRRGQLESKAVDESNRQTARAEALEAYNAQGRKFANLQFRANVDEKVAELLGIAKAQATEVLTRQQLPQAIERFLVQTTAGHYARIAQGAGSLAIHSDGKGGALTDEELSTGTRDQFYLAMRLGYLVTLCPHDRPPLVLDDPLLHCDPERRRAILEGLAAYSTDPHGGQVILFSAQDFPEYTAYPCHILGGA